MKNKDVMTFLGDVRRALRRSPVAELSFNRKLTSVPLKDLTGRGLREAVVSILVEGFIEAERPARSEEPKTLLSALERELGNVQFVVNTDRPSSEVIEEIARTIALAVQTRDQRIEKLEAELAYQKTRHEIDDKLITSKSKELSEQRAKHSADLQKLLGTLANLHQRVLDMRFKGNVDDGLAQARELIEKSIDEKLLATAWPETRYSWSAAVLGIGPVVALMLYSSLFAKPVSAATTPAAPSAPGATP